MTSEAAVDILQRRINEYTAAAPPADTASGPLGWLVAAAGRPAAPAAAPPVAEVDALSRLALLLAHERAKGPASFWAPYIASLPDAPPCAWLMAREQLEGALAAVNDGAAGAAARSARWAAAVGSAAAVMRRRAASLAAAYGAALGVDVEGVVWALGHVVSRCFGSNADVALAPLIDSCNHAAGAGTPWALAAPGGSALVCVSPAAGGLEAGEELCISYGPLEAGSGETALGVFLNFGFVPCGMELTE
jgi:hypothetical protein